MPLPTDSLTRDSSTEVVRQAVSATISQCMDEGGKNRNQCVAIALESARRRTGRGLGQGGSTTRQGLAVEDGK